MIIKCEKCGAAFEFGEDFVPTPGKFQVTCGNCRSACSIYPEMFPENSADTDDTAFSESRALKKREAASTKIRLLFSALVLLILALGFNAILSLSSLEKLYVESIVSQYDLIGRDLKRTVEKSLRFGKSIRKFVGMPRLLEEIKDDIGKTISPADQIGTPFKKSATTDTTVSVSLPNGKISYSTDPKMAGASLPDGFRGIVRNADSVKSASGNYFKYGKKYLVILPVVDGNKEWVADISISFDEGQVKSLLNHVMKNNFVTILIILSIGTLILMVFVQLITSGTEGKEFPKLKISILMFLVIGISQIVFSGLNTRAFNGHYLRINKEKTEMLTVLLREDIEFLLSKGLRLDKLFKMEAMMGEIIDSAPEIRDITVFDRNEAPLYMATKTGVVDFGKTKGEKPPPRIEDPDYNVRSSIRRAGKIEGYISATTWRGPYVSTNISKEAISKKFGEIVLDSVTVLAISFLFFLELLILTFQYVEKRLKENGSVPGTDYMAIRPVAFLFFFGIDISISFLPLHMENLYEPIWGLSKDICMGLPISMRMLSTSLSILIAGVWCDRRGWHEPFLVGLFLSAAGFLYSWQAPNAVHFILSFGLVGLGYGLALMSTQGFVIANTTPHNRARGLAHLYAGIWAGNICGGAVGGMLADRIGYNPVFFIGAVIIFSVIFITFFFMKWSMKAPQSRHDKNNSEKVGAIQVIRFLFNKKILSLTLFSSLPAAIVLVGFLHYFSPIFLKEAGTSQSNIGRIIMIYGICMVYISPFVTRFVSGSKHTKAFIAIGGVIGSLAFVCFNLLSETSGSSAIILGVLMLGLSASFAACRNAYALNLAVSKEIGEGKAMSIFYSMARIGQIVGPILFGWLLFSPVGVGDGIAILGASYLVVTLLFVLFG